jgi:hypothetical protein
VSFLGADDKVLPGFFEKSMKLLARYPQAGVCDALTRIVTEKGTDLGVWPSFRISRAECFLPPAKAQAVYREYGPMWHAGYTATYRRNALIEAGGFRPELRSHSDRFVFQVLAVKYGACYIPEPLGVMRVRENSYSSEQQSSEVFVDLMKRAVDLMRSDYRQVFPDQYVQEFWKEILYSPGIITYWKLKLQHDECLAQLHRSLAPPNLLDRLFLSGLRFCMAAQLLCVRLYLFTRLRHFSWPLLRRKVKSLWK